MPVLAEGFSVIARLDALEKRYPGGREGYKSDCPNFTYCEDDNVCRVGFMSSTDALDWVDEIEAKGLVIERDGEFVDIALVSSLSGLFDNCGWVDVEWDQEGIFWAKLKSDSSLKKVAHEGFSGEKMGFVDIKDIKDIKDITEIKSVQQKSWWQFWR